ncbi:septation protein SpoVG [Candidatus Desantisbacteria bacterium CG1_02_38_46]|uniref:Putative septation protein SpoVG n=2 Tax=unclassified Candidatus Desantisiibacteriota TaxID=3106372 RepID=A0A1J4SCA5_9BACT|nr:MAG: septation protein SpoVG [Candidatus Desantisbacteria bacterium CG1_02_38_46]PIU50917.1 MAG: septation protein SpoVG [Candidatus Desantisbacteria bacterium CG07_land_8_20_14_0_80_39_15]
MEITEVRIFLRDNTGKPEDKLKAFATVTFDNSFVVRGLRVVSGDRGLFVAMPSRKLPDGTRRDVAHPINSEMRQNLEKKIIEAYNEKLKEGPSPKDKSAAEGV